MGSIFRNLSGKGYNGMRPMKQSNFFSFGVMISAFMMPFYYFDSITIDHGDTYDHQVTRMNGMRMPLGNMNFRTSANYLEINRIYGAEMLRRFENRKEQLRAERQGCTAEEKHTRYARSGYQYVASPAPAWA